jgi:hypothetical protein
MSKNRLAAKVLLLVMVCAFFGYVLFWVVKSVPWVVDISLNPRVYYPAAGLQNVDALSMAASFLMEYAGFAGLLVRLGGAVFALVSVFLLLKGGTVFSARVRSKISWALLLEGIYFFSLIPSVYYLLGFSSLPLTSRICLSTALTTQMVLISPVLIALSRQLRKPDDPLEKTKITRLAVLSCLVYVVALYVTYWTKWLEMSILEGLHWLLSLPVVVAFVNTAITFTIAVVFAVFATRYSLKRPAQGKSMRLWGAAAFFFSLHLIIFVAYCVSVNAAWMAEFGELWMIPLMAVGIYLLLRKTNTPMIKV